PQINCIHSRRFTHQPGERLLIHHSLDPKIILDQCRHGKRYRPALPFKEINFDEVAHAHSENIGKHARERQAALGEHDRPEVNVDNAAEVSVAWPAADRHATLDVAVSYADWDFPVRLDHKNTWKSRYLHDDLSRTFFNQAHGRILTVGHEKRHVNQVLHRSTGEKRDDQNRRRERYAKHHE